MACFGPKCPFWGHRRSSAGPRGPILVPTAPDWPALVGIMVTIHFDLISGPLMVPGGPKRAVWAWSLNFHGPISCDTFFVLEIKAFGVSRALQRNALLFSCIVLYCILFYCMLFHGIALHCIVLNRTSSMIYCIKFNCIACNFIVIVMALYHIVIYLIVFHRTAWYSIVLHGI